MASAPETCTCQQALISPFVIAYRDLLWVALILSIADSAVFLNNHGPATITLRAERPAVSLAEGSLCIAHEEGLAVLRNAIDLGPSTHDESIIGSNDHNQIYTL